MNLLEILNSHNGATLHILSRQAGLTRGTAYRILETLRHEGYVRKDAGSPSYWLEERLRYLSEGYSSDGWIEKLARPVVESLGREVKWPVKLLTLSGSLMVTRVTTDFSSPYTDGKYPTGFRVSLLWSAAGRAYLAFCDTQTTEILVKMAEMPQEVLNRNPEARAVPRNLDIILRTIRQDGFSLMDQPPMAFSSLAVPVLKDGGVIASLCMHYFRAVLTPEQAVGSFAPMLKAAAEKIGHTLPGETAATLSAQS